MEEEEPNTSYFMEEPMRKYESISVCNCLRDDESSEKVKISERKIRILSTVSRTETYLRERRIPEFIRFLLTKVIAQGSDKPVAYLRKLLNDCMLFRAGHGLAPVLYEKRHLEAVIKSFDPGQRGWLSAGQMRRAYITLGLTPEATCESVSTEVALKNMETAQERELLQMINAGTMADEGGTENEESKESSSITLN